MLGLNTLPQALLDLLFPPRCEVCEVLGAEAFCAPCREQTLMVNEPYCRLCGQLFQLSEARQTLCASCREQPPRFDGARTVGLHTGTLRRAVLNFKFENRRRLQEPLGELLADRFTRELQTEGGLPWKLVDALVPVPLHPRRRAWRGFDQSLHLAQAMSERCGVPVVSDGMIRVRPTTPQVELSTRERHENVRKAFAPAGDVLRGRNLLLIDDVYTTGATASEAARAAKTGGARHVYVLTISRPPPGWHPAGFAMEPGDRLGL